MTGETDILHDAWCLERYSTVQGAASLEMHAGEDFILICCASHALLLIKQELLIPLVHSYLRREKLALFYPRVACCLQLVSLKYLQDQACCFSRGGEKVHKEVIYNSVSRPNLESTDPHSLVWEPASV